MATNQTPRVTVNGVIHDLAGTDPWTPALDWLRTSLHEDPRLQRLAAQLTAALASQGGAK